MFYVYELRDATGKPFYIGKGNGLRMHQHEHQARNGRKSKLAAKLRKMQRLGQKVLKVVVLDTDNEAEAFTEEKRLIAHYGRKTLANQTDGGDGVSNPSPSVRERIAASRRGKKASVRTRLRQRQAKLGTRHSAETRAKISAAQRLIKKPWAVHSTPNLGDGFKGHKWSKSHRTKFRAKRLGHKVSAATRKKISKSKLGSIPWNKKIKR